MNIHNIVSRRRPVQRSGMTALAGLVALSGALLLPGCSPRKDAAPAAAAAPTEVAVKVNGDEITVQQLNFVLKQQRSLRPEQLEAAKYQMLERLIDQQLAMQKAEKEKLDREPRVMQALEAARREVLTHFYIEQVAEKAGKPTPEDIQKYYDGKPASFAQRKIYSITKIDASVPPERRDEVVARAQGAKSSAEVADWMKAQNIRFNSSQSQQASESLGPMLEKISALKDGQSTAVPQQFGVTVLTVSSTQTSPVSLEQARPQIEQQLANERKRDAVLAEGKALREGAKIEYVGVFVPGAASAAASGAAMPVPRAALPGPVPASAASSAMNAASVNKGPDVKR